jgi:ankyrin repeat protein
MHNKQLILPNTVIKKNIMKTNVFVTFFLHLLVLLVASTSHQALADETNENKQYDELMPYFYAAARTGDNDVITEFLNAGLPVDIKNEKGYTALMIATYNGQQVIVDKLIKSGANVCAQDNKGNTALMAAVFRGEFSIAKTLMSENCDENQQNKAGQTAVMYATLFGREDLRALLIERGADINLQDNSGNSATTIEQIK